MCAVTGTYTGDLTCANNPASVGPDVGTFPIAPVVSGTGQANFEITLTDGLLHHFEGAGHGHRRQRVRQLQRTDAVTGGVRGHRDLHRRFDVRE